MYDVPYPLNRFDKVAPHLWIGGHVVRGSYDNYRAVEVRREDGFDHVISLYTNIHSRLPDNVKIHTIGEINDGHYPSDREISIIEMLAEQAHWSMALGWDVLIRCQAGYNRSAIVAARVLMNSGMTATEAIAAVREARGTDTLCNLHFVKYLETKQRDRDATLALVDKVLSDHEAGVVVPMEAVRRRRPGRIRRADEPTYVHFPGQMAIDDGIPEAILGGYKEADDVQPE